MIRTIFREYLRGNTLEEVRRIAFAKGFTRQSKSDVTRVLNNPICRPHNVPAYKNQPAKVVKGIHSAIVSDEEYWTMRQKLSGKNYRHQKSDDVPLRGILHRSYGKLMNIFTKP